MQYQRDQKQKAAGPGVDNLSKEGEDLGSLEQLEKTRWGTTYQLNSLETQNRFGIFDEEQFPPPGLEQDEVDEQMLVDYFMEYKSNDVKIIPEMKESPSYRLPRNWSKELSWESVEGR